MKEDEKGSDVQGLKGLEDSTEGITVKKRSLDRFLLSWFEF